MYFSFGVAGKVFEFFNMESPTPIDDQLPINHQERPRTVTLYSFKDPEASTQVPVVNGACVHIDEFQKLNRIGEGTYGIVYRAKHKTNGEVVALKRIRMEFTNEEIGRASCRERV